MYEKEFAKRLYNLRKQQGVSARSMSLDIGQNEGYISSIETGKSMPSLYSFFFICEYLNITPKEFFDEESENPAMINDIVKDLKHLDAVQLETIAALIKTMIKK